MIFTEKLGAQVDRKYQWNKAFEPLEIGDKRWGKTAYVYDANGQIGEANFDDGTKERFSYDIAKNTTGFGEAEGIVSGWHVVDGGRITEAKGGQWRTYSSAI